MWQHRSSGRPRVFGHRGAMGYAPENTFASFERAVEIGVDAIELDVHLSADGEVVVIHDHILERTTDGEGVVRRSDAGRAEAARRRHALRASIRRPAHPDPRRGAGLGARALRPRHRDQGRAVAVPGHRGEGRGPDPRSTRWSIETIVISFDHPTVARVKALAPEIAAGTLWSCRPDRSGGGGAGSRRQRDPAILVVLRRRDRGAAPTRPGSRCTPGRRPSRPSIERLIGARRGLDLQQSPRPSLSGRCGTAPGDVRREARAGAQTIAQRVGRYADARAATPDGLPARPAEIAEAVRRWQRHALLVARPNEDLALAALHGGVEQAHHLGMVADQSLSHLRRSLRRTLEAGRWHTPARERSRLDRASPTSSHHESAPFSRGSRRHGNRLPITVASQGRLTPYHEQLCDCNREPDAEQHEPELDHAFSLVWCDRRSATPRANRTWPGITAASRGGTIISRTNNTADE